MILPSQLYPPILVLKNEIHHSLKDIAVTAFAYLNHQA